MRKDNHNWSASLLKLKAQRPERKPVREERLKTTSLHQGASILPLSGWRGASGRRYVAGIYRPIRLDDLYEFATEVVILAVRRPDIGLATILDARDAVPGSVRSWIDAVFASGATELHVHRLAQTTSERAAVLTDLLESEPETETAA